MDDFGSNSVVLEFDSCLLKSVHGSDVQRVRKFRERESKFGVKPTYAMIMFTNKAMEPNDSTTDRDLNVIKTFKLPSLFVEPSVLAAKRSEAVANEAAARRVRAELGKEAAPPVPQIQYFLKRPILVELRQMSNHRLAMIRYHADWYRDYLRRIEAKKLLGYYQSNGEILLSTP